MTITKNRVPYEFLVRMDSNGKIAGAHIQFRDILEEDGVFLSEKTSEAMPVSLAGEAGFPLSEIIDLAHSAALSTVESLNAQLAQAVKDAETALNAHNLALATRTTERDQANADLITMTSNYDKLTADLAAMTSERDALQTNVSEFDAFIKLRLDAAVV